MRPFCRHRRERRQWQSGALRQHHVHVAGVEHVLEVTVAAASGVALRSWSRQGVLVLLLRLPVQLLWVHGKMHGQCERTLLWMIKLGLPLLQMKCFLIEFDRVYPNSKTRQVSAVFLNANSNKNLIFRNCQNPNDPNLEKTRKLKLD